MSAKTYFQVDGFQKFSEQDVYENGSIPGTGTICPVDVEFKADTVEGLLEKVSEFFGVNASDIEKNACDKDGRIDVALHENENGYQAGEYDLEKWKENTLKLWCVVYSGYIVKITEEKVTL